MEEITSDIILAICFLSLGSVLTFGFIYIIDYTPTQTLSKIEYSECSNLSLFETSDCLNSELKGWFNYNLSNLNKEMNLSELKKLGGTCSDYANWYKDNYINLGFNAKSISISADDTGHELTVAWTKNLSDGKGSYCIADQTQTACFNLGEVNMTLYKELTKK